MSYRLPDLAREAVRTARSGLAYRSGLPARRPSTHSRHAICTTGQWRPRPVLLLHGFLQTHASLNAVGAAVNRSGYDTYSYNYKTIGAGVSSAADGLAVTIDECCADAGVPDVHIVAHSMGGLVARAALDNPGTAARVRSVVTLGTPHDGTPAANRLRRVLPGLHRLVDQFAPDSEMIADLAGADPGRNVTWAALYSPDDHLVPGTSGRLCAPAYRATNLSFPGVGHAGLLYDPAVIATVIELLNAADADTPADTPAGAGRKSA